MLLFCLCLVVVVVVGGTLPGHQRSCCYDHRRGSAPVSAGVAAVHRSRAEAPGRRRAGVASRAPQCRHLGRQPCAADCCSRGTQAVLQGRRLCQLAWLHLWAFARVPLQASRRKYDCVCVWVPLDGTASPLYDNCVSMLCLGVLACRFCCHWQLAASGFGKCCSLRCGPVRECFTRRAGASHYTAHEHLCTRL